MTPTRASIPGTPPARTLRRFALAAPLAALMFAAPLAANDDPAPAPVQHYDIPAQPLGAALSRYAQTSGVDVLLDEPQAAGRRSSAVKGGYAPPQALHILLQGTGLIARFTSRRSAVIMPVEQVQRPLPPATTTGQTVIALDMMKVTAPRLVGSPRPDANMPFIRAMANRIRTIMVDADAVGRGANARVRVQTRIGSDGTLHDVRVVIASADRRRDARIVALLEGRRLDLTPPDGLRQPILFDLAGR
ncbi:hypothetical protein SAMN06295912_112103 [Sphingomonas laterariae]|uniref:Secretin/TonB short N-terminal domain-containing protein n=1 Tax=Edaphosphingomonas laterariae TaxID=861865 RepID=A0A239GJA0_9SPHN|nr:STN domain-containing protein [Sphingomonas laterariae]SNS69210.1 hypothetical protein SAMN06295912_112103 [Sphingomonas laterariae]